MAMTPKTKQNIAYALWFIIQAAVYYVIYLLFLYIWSWISKDPHGVSFIQPLFFCIPMSLIVVGFQIHKERHPEKE